MKIFAILLLVLALGCMHTKVSAKCSLAQRIGVCSAIPKAGFASAFSIAVAAPAVGCKTLTRSQWKRVGCDSPASHRSTKICAPAKWTRLLKLFATAMALKKKILVKSPWTISKLINTSSGRKLLRHELAHIRQQSGVGAYKWGYRYISAYCSAGCSYSKNKFEKEARKFENDNC